MNTYKSQKFSYNLPVPQKFDVQMLNNDLNIRRLIILNRDHTLLVCTIGFESTLHVDVEADKLK